MTKGKQHDDDRLLSNEYDPKMALSVADSFYNAAERCNEQVYTGDHQFIWLPGPASVNYAFSCEIYMKALLMEMSAKASRGHNLLVLFDLLPYKVQMEIQQTFDVSESSFREMLESVSDLFQECRYLYEYKSLHINLGFLQELACSLKTAAGKRILARL